MSADQPEKPPCRSLVIVCAPADEAYPGMAKIRQMIDQECRRGLFVETYTVTLLAVRCSHHEEWRVMRGEYRETLARVFGPKPRDGIHAQFQQGGEDTRCLRAGEDTA